MIKVKLGRSRTQMSVEDMKDFIESFSAIPDDPKTPFIVAHELAQNEDGTFHLSVIISSHALIDLILKDPSDKLIQVDFTHNDGHSGLDPTESCGLR